MVSDSLIASSLIVSIPKQTAESLYIACPFCSAYPERTENAIDSTESGSALPDAVSKKDPFSMADSIGV